MSTVREQRKKNQQRNKKNTKELHSRNFTALGMDAHPVVSTLSLLTIAIFMIYVFSDPSRAQNQMSNFRNILTTKLDWYFLFSANIILFFCLFIAFSKMGNIRIGGVKAKSEYKTSSWIAMLMSAGIGIGMMYYGVLEPLGNYVKGAPFWNQQNPGTAVAAASGHWGFQAWAIYALVGISLSFFAFNKKLPLSFRSIFHPIFGNKIFGPWGDIIDIFSVLACLFGLAVSLGLGAAQICSGLESVLGIKNTFLTQAIFIVVITGVASLSVVSGINKGVQFLSEINIYLAGILMAMVIILGPSLFILRTASDSLGVYLGDFLTFSFWMDTTGTLDPDHWRSAWTVFYWAWWFSWSPFVGIFIARISYGRTVREMVLATIILPTLLGVLWFSTLGGTGIEQYIRLGADYYSQINVDNSLFMMIQNLQLPAFLQKIHFESILSGLGILLVMIFFVTSSDSGSLVVDNLTSGGKLDTPKPQRLFWAIMEGVVALTLLRLGGTKALSAMQAGLVTTGLPFSILLLIAMYSLHKALKKEYLYHDEVKFEEKLLRADLEEIIQETT